MDWQFLSSTHYVDTAGDRLIRTAHVWIPDPSGTPRLYFLQADILSAPAEADCHATVSVLTPEFEWAEILSRPAAKWRGLVPSPTGRENDSKYPLNHLAAGMLTASFGVLAQKLRPDLENP